MYRLLSTQGTLLQNVYFVSVQTRIQRSMQLCSFCKYYHRKTPKFVGFLQIRCHAATINLLEQDTIVKKKIKQKLKKYAELLEVTDQTTSSKKAAVKKLNAACLSVLVDQPDISLAELHKIKNSQNKKKSDKCKHTDTDNRRSDSSTGNRRLTERFYDKSGTADRLRRSSMVDDRKSLNTMEKGLTTSTVAKQITEKSSKSKWSQKKKQKAKTSAAAVERNIEKDKHYVKVALAHMLVNIGCGMPDKAYRILIHCKKKIKAKSQAYNSYVSLYNVLLEAYASKGQLDNVSQLYRIMKEDSVPPTPQTYASMFLCIGSLENRKHTDLLRRIESEMVDNGISFADIFNKSVFRVSQREAVLKAIQHIHPDFEPSYVSPDVLPSSILFNGISRETSKRKSPAEGIVSDEELRQYLINQLFAECESEVTVKSIEKHEETESALESSERFAKLEKSWEEAVSRAFDRSLEILKHTERNSSKSLMSLYPFFKVLDKRYYVNAIMREIRALVAGSESFTLPQKILFADLGKMIYRKYELKRQTESGTIDKVIGIYTRYIDWYLHPETYSQKNIINYRTAWQQFQHDAEKEGASLDTSTEEWPHSVCQVIGKFLYKIILNDVKINVNYMKAGVQEHFIPAFYSIFRDSGKNLVEQIKPHPLVVKLYKESERKVLTFDTASLPSLCPSRPWTSTRTGGYLISKIEFMRAPPYATDCFARLENTDAKKLYATFDSLNQLGSVPWTVNTPVLDVIIEVFQNGGSTELDVPRPPSVLPPIPPLSPDATTEERLLNARARAKLRRTKAEMYSLWCDALYKLSIAAHLKDKIFWLPHNMDFRGRVYPIPPHLNHLGADLARSILLFAQGKPLGPRGLDWLKIHAINLTGSMKKSSIDERLEHANKILDDIVESAEKPLTGKMWWAKSDEPWQTLAACKEIAAALKSPNAEEYSSKFPIHQDGSCNGLQHYAALGRDQIGAESVNLYPHEKPQDVYSTVAGMIERERQKDASNGVKVAQLLDGFVRRKVVKQTVMTTVYGVTKYGARLQIAKQLNDLDEFSEENVWRASLYLTDKTFHSLRTMFTSAKEIQDWLTTCAQIISRDLRRTVEWITPLGLPVVQPYFKRLRMSEDMENLRLPIDTIKQRNAFPPNFIHSLDSSHMMLTSIHCEHAGITFVSVHDCYWTHARTIEIMNRICREQFVALHSLPILEDLAEFFDKTYVEPHSDNRKNEAIEAFKCKLKAVPQKGDFDLRKVLESVYFFS